ncbi:protein CA_C1420-like [Oscarella lobularis]|uniref:protein CA_C1420-like n=1 Tax=Oscarella lobularis TaxID=121494 RepID=UPI003313CFFE
MRSLWLFVALVTLRPAKSEIVGAFVLPHGGIALDPAHFPTANATIRNEAWALHEACVDVASVIARLAPDVVLVSTPHGVADLKSFVVYLNEKAAGSADTDNCACPPCCYDVQVAMDAELATNLVSHLGVKNSNVSGLSAFGPPRENSEIFPLMWGEVIPLYFTLGATGLNKTTKVVVLSQPSRRYNHSIEMIGELTKLGQDMHVYLSSIRERIAIIVSGDLAHTHLKSGPYGYSSAAEPFDKACGYWASTLIGSYLIDDAARYANKALSCGYTGFVMLQGILSSGGTWKPRLLANYHPSYYGMMVASFLPDNSIV